MNEADLTVTVPPRVKVPGVARLLNGDEVLGVVDTEFDFSNCPPEYHELALQVVGRRTDIHMGGLFQAIEEKKEEEKKSWLRRLFSL